ncbi:MAG: TolC family protein [Pseudomonadota bacterium]
MKRLILLCVSTAALAGCVVTPKPFSADEIEAQSLERQSAFTAEQEAISGPISIYEATARALKYNLDYKVELFDEALRTRELKLAQYDLLPQLVANAGYTGRNNFSGASSSQILAPREIGAQTLVASTSAERNFFTQDLTVSWDVLDFGLSYVRAKQKADEVLIAQERRRKVVSRIVEDVRTAYWRAVSAERLIGKLTILESDIIEALASSDRAYEQRKTPPLSALTYQRELLTIKEEIQDLQRELSVSKQQLAALMNIDPGEPFELVLPDRDQSEIDFAMAPDDMVDIALRSRPELREISYQQRINDKEAKAALLDLLPSLRAYGGFNYDSNDFLFNNNWVGWGTRASWNLVEAFRYPARKKTIKAEAALLDQRALALTMAVVTQVHVSRTRFELAKRRVDTMRSYHDVQDKILDQIDAGFSAKRVSRQTLIREKMNEIVAEAKYDIALADLHNAFANIHSSMGLDPFGVDVRSDLSVGELSDLLKTQWDERGETIANAEPVSETPVDETHIAAIE